MAGKSKNRKRWDAVTTVAYPLLFAVLLIAAWQTKLLHRLLHVDTFILPIPTRILTIIQENWGAIAENLQSTVIVIVIGLRSRFSPLGRRRSDHCVLFQRSACGSPCAGHHQLDTRCEQ